jgi:hypothetical protein
MNLPAYRWFLVAGQLLVPMLSWLFAADRPGGWEVVVAVVVLGASAGFLRRPEPERGHHLGLSLDRQEVTCCVSCSLRAHKHVRWAEEQATPV